MCLRNEAVWKRVYKHLVKPNATASDIFPNFAVYRTPFDVNVAIAGMSTGIDSSTDLRSNTTSSDSFP